MASALVFELSKVGLESRPDADAVQPRQCRSGTLAERVAAGLNVPLPKASASAAPVQDFELSPALRVIDGPLAPDSIKGRAVGVLVTDGADATAGRRARYQGDHRCRGQGGGRLAPKVGGAKLSDGKLLPADGQLAGTPSVLVDAIALVVSEEGCAAHCSRMQRRCNS